MRGDHGQGPYAEDHFWARDGWLVRLRCRLVQYTDQPVLQDVRGLLQLRDQPQDVRTAERFWEAVARGA
eukprot:5108007-Pleurochrysis_carterae.AAC.1